MGTVMAEREVKDLATATPGPATARPRDLVIDRGVDASRNGSQPRLYRIGAAASNLQETALVRGQDTAGEPAEKRLELALTFPSGSSLSEADRAEVEGRYRIIEPLLHPERFDALWVEKGRQRSVVIASLARENGVSRRTIYAWLRAFELNGPPALVRKDRSDKGFSKRFEGAPLEFILAAALSRPGMYGELSAREIFRAYQEEQAWRAVHVGKPLCDADQARYRRYIVPETGCLMASAQLPQASYETFRVWFNRIPEAVKTYARQGEDSFHDTQEILSYRDLDALHPLDFVVMDHRLLDIFCMVRMRGTWRLVRPWLTGALDMRSRKWLAWVIVETPSSDSIASVLKQVLLAFGIPAAVYWDNGRDFTCHWLEGRQAKTHVAKRVNELGDGMRGVLDRLGVRVHHAIIQRARSKIIEANFVNVANFDRTLPWWCGHKPTSRPSRFETLIEEHGRWLKGETKTTPFPTIEEISALYDDFLNALNEREHSGQGMQKVTPSGRGWMCPNECWEREIGKVERRTISAELVQFCFQKRRRLTVRHGEIQATFGGRTYHYRMPGSPLRLMELNGREVDFGYDPLDLETGTVYYENRFVGLVACVELRRMGETAFVADERDRRAARREIKKVIKSVHQQVYVPGAAERLARRLPVQPVRTEPARLEAPANVPAALLEAARALEEERLPVEAVEVPVLPSRAADADSGEFVFFQRDK